MDLSKQYRKHTHREHILSLPDTYIGSIENTSEEHYIIDGESFKNETVNPFNPGFYKLFDELLVNAHDHVVRFYANAIHQIQLRIFRFRSKTILLLSVMMVNPSMSKSIQSTVATFPK